jgi:hypothetical protein
MVRELTDWHTHAEHYQVKRGKTWYGSNHITQSPPLLDQLQYASPSGLGEDGGGGGYKSRPAARIEALDTLIQIDKFAARWVRDLGEDDPADKIDPATGLLVHGSGTIACVRLLGSLAPSQDRRTQAKIVADVRRWWTWARIATGWDSPAWRPDNTCPACGVRGTLRVNLVAQIGTCVDDGCRETWDEGSIGILAEHIRVESESERVPVGPAPPCWCRWPAIRQGRWGLCPVCGSAYCTGAEAEAVREEDRRRVALEASRLRRLEEARLLWVKTTLEAVGMAGVGRGRAS